MEEKQTTSNHLRRPHNRRVPSIEKGNGNVWIVGKSITCSTPYTKEKVQALDRGFD
jgi:hypothetical protein